MTTLFVCLLVPSMQDQDALHWPKLSARPLGFAAEFPVQPKRQALKDKGPDDKGVTITIYRADVEDKRYLVTISAFSEEYMKQPLETIYDNARNGSLARSGGKLVSERKIMIGKYEGRESIVQAQDAGYVRAWICVAHGQQYAVMVAAKNKADIESQDAERFLKAFKITAIAKDKKQ